MPQTRASLGIVVANCCRDFRAWATGADPRCCSAAGGRILFGSAAAGQTQILRTVERGGGPNAPGRPSSRPRRPSVDRRANWWPCPGMAWAPSGDDILVSRSLSRAAGTPGAAPAQQSPAARIGDCSEPSWPHSVAASGPHQALHRTLAPGPAAKVRTVTKTKARNIQRLPLTHRSKNEANRRVDYGPVNRGRREHSHARR